MVGTPFAWRNLTHRKVRALVALTGVSFSVLLMFMQVGFYDAILASATAPYRTMNGDIFLTSPLYVYLGRTGSIPRQRLFQVEGVAGVRTADAFFADILMWRNTETHLRHPMLVMAFAPSSGLMNISRESMQLLGDGRILVDSLTRPHFGPQVVGLVTEIGDRQVSIAGQYRIGPGFATDGAAIMDDDTFIRMFKRGSIESPSFGVVRTKAGADVTIIAAALRRMVPADTRVFTREEMILREEDYWANQTSIGPVFAAGAVLGLVIGIVILYQVMATDITNRIREYATLKALGYEGFRLTWIVLQEVSAFSLAGSAVGVLLSAGLYWIVRDSTGLPMTMEPGRCASILLLTFLMCWTAGLLAVRKLRKADPAELF